MKQSSIKSQFACTYKNDLSEMSGQHSHGIPTCKRPVLPKQHLKTGKCTGKLWQDWVSKCDG